LILLVSDSSVLIDLERGDLLPLAFASARPQHALLTSDGPLRRVADRLGVARFGLLWLLDRIAELRPAEIGTLHAGLTLIAKHPRCRQPAAEVRDRLQRWKP